MTNRVTFCYRLRHMTMAKIAQTEFRSRTFPLFARRKLRVSCAAFHISQKRDESGHGVAGEDQNFRAVADLALRAGASRISVMQSANRRSQRCESLQSSEVKAISI
ncbi:hypothetical protein [Rudaea sp.]|uniref:hypothetical protein n=1 Tax=Rudaea sp. TaxID=2136325 RepID=UPI002ED2E28A